MTRLFAIGATGYVGGSVLSDILKVYPDFEVTALVRTQEKADLLKTASNGRILTILGDLDDLDLIENATKNADIIINAASNSHLPSLQSIKKALASKKTSTLFIHTSGAGVLADSVDPAHYNPSKEYSDVKDIDEINSLPDTQPHRPADKLVQTIQDSNPDYVKTAIVSPPTIFGIGYGFDNKISAQIPYLVKSVVRVGHNFTVYEGNTAWSHVHIEDVAALYILIVQKFVAKESFPSGYKGYYFAADGTPHLWKDVAMAVTKLLVARKLISDPRIDKLSPEEVEKQFGLPALFWGSNVKTIPDLGKSIGWKPTKSSDSEFWASIDAEVDFMQKHGILHRTLSSH
ncbi:hypothetical protein KL928_000784 [Ogataea angusta]|uniref:NAD(P)-binding domain-containing protein n=1 Tax=Pichia angusta TaxID=870730 RepID=A0AAN6I8K5_PICAN|nr:uncharacterized protein KL928_000784 [Ogataea angusta]KAG7822309.1 hypothetical protein KL928_000784 [Ogataea angusta]